MSIASEIARLQGVKSDILQAISDKGVDVPSGSKLDDCPDLIASISGGGGGGNVVNVDGIDYEFVRIGKYYFTTENLKNIFSELTLNGPVSQPSYRWFWNNETTALQNKYNIAYSVQSIDYVNKHAPSGWRCADKTEWDYIGQNFGNVNKLESWNDNELGLSLVRNGNGDNYGTWFNIGNIANMLSKITLCSFGTSSYTNSGTIIDRFAAIRLVKDVE